MIVECGNCETRFQLDASRVPARGIRVRCSRCKEAFFLRNPEASAEEATHDAAAAAVAGPSPGATHDLPSGGAEFDASGLDDREEESWEFNDEPRPPDPNEDSIPDFDAPHGAPDYDSVDLKSDFDAESEGFQATMDPDLGLEDPDDALGAYAIESESGLDLAGDPGPALEAGGLEADGLDGLDDDLTSAEEETQEQEVGRSDLTEFGEVSDFSDVSSELEADEAARAQEAVAAGSAAPAGVDESGDVVGEPEEWDFLSEDTLERPYPHDDAMGRAMAELSAEVAEQSSAADGPGLVGSAAILDSRPQQTKLGLVGHALGWVATLALFLVGLGWGVVREPVEAHRAPVVAPLGDFHAESVRGSWLDTARAGRMYVVRGRLVNDSAAGRPPAASLRVALVAASGGPLDVPPALAAAPLADGYLRELAPVELASLHSSAAADLSWAIIEPGGSRDFAAFFTDVPDDAAGFVLEMESVPAPAAAPPPVTGEASVLEPVQGEQGESLPGAVLPDAAAPVAPFVATPTSPGHEAPGRGVAD